MTNYIRPLIIRRHQRRPYAYRAGAGGQIKKGFNTARKKLCAWLIEQDQPQRAEVIAKITPHWARHNFANTLRAANADLLDITEAGMWESPETVRKYYMSDAPERVAKQVRALDFGTISEKKPAQRNN